MPAKSPELEPFVCPAMPQALSCPHCGYEFLSAEPRPGEATVCPRCFQVVPVAPLPFPTPTNEHPHLWDEFLKQLDTSEAPELNNAPSDSISVQTPAADQTLATQAVPATERPPTNRSSPPAVPRSASTHDTHLAILLGCVFPLVVLTALLAFLVWYVLRYT